MRQALAAGLIAFAYLVLGASSAHYWLDSGELGAAGVGLGVTHPPGAPGYAILLRATAMVPVGNLGFRMAVMSSLLGAAVVFGVFVLLSREKARPWVSWGAAAWVIAGWTFVRQARVVELYAFEGALLIAALWGLDPRVPEDGRAGRRLIGVMAAVWAAWSFGDLRLALVPAVVVAWAFALRRKEAWAIWAPLCTLAMSAVVLALPLASARAPVADWGDPDHLSSLVEHVGAQAIRTAYADEILPASLAMWGHNASAFVGQLAEDLGGLGPSVAALGLGALWLRRAEPQTGARLVATGLTWLVVIEFFYAVGINPMGIEERQNGLVLAPLCALVVGELIGRVVENRPRLRWALPPLLWTLLALPAGLLSIDDAVATRSWGPHGWTRAALAQLPPGATLLTQSDDLSAGVAWARVAEGARPDVATAPGQHLHKPRPDFVDADHPAAGLWAAAHKGRDEASRIEAAVRHAPAAVALEHAAATIFTRVRFWSDGGLTPLRIAGPGVTPQTHARRSPDEAIDHWLPRLPSDEDRGRLAHALAADARARVRVHGDVPGAIAELESSLRRVEEDHPSALVALAALYARSGDAEAAIRLTRRALELDPDRAAALNNLALYLSGDPNTQPEALALAERATSLRPWDKKGWERLATVHERRGDAEAAAAARARVLD